MRKIKAIEHYGTGILHVETHGCVINIRAQLKDRFMREVTSIEILPDEYSGYFWVRKGPANVRVVKLKGGKKSTKNA